LYLLQQYTYTYAHKLMKNTMSDWYQLNTELAPQIIYVSNYEAM